MQRKLSQLEETLQNFIKSTQSSFEQVNKNHETISRNHDAFIKNSEIQIDQLFRQIIALPSSSEGFTGNTVDNPKNKSCKALETCFKVATNKGEEEIVEEGLVEKEEVRIEKEESNNQSD